MAQNVPNIHWSSITILINQKWWTSPNILLVRFGFPGMWSHFFFNRKDLYCNFHPMCEKGERSLHIHLTFPPPEIKMVGLGCKIFAFLLLKGDWWTESYQWCHSEHGGDSFTILCCILSRYLLFPFFKLKLNSGQCVSPFSGDGPAWHGLSEFLPRGLDIRDILM